MELERAPIELIDSFEWGKHSKIITRDVHGISGLMNFTHFSRLSAGPATPMHFHRGIMEIHCIVKGRRVTRFYRDGEILTVTYTGGEAVAVFPGEYHATGNETRQDPCELYAMQLNLAEAEDFLGLNPTRGRELCRRLEEMPHRLVRVESDDLRLLREAFELFSTGDARDRDGGLMHLVCFLYRYLKLQPAGAPLRTPSDQRIRRVIEYVEQNAAEPMNLTALAEVAGYSLSRFKIRFREETGQTPAQYVTASKVERAKLELERTEQSVTDIAYNLGWSSGNYFCTVFKKLTGLSPLQYRKQYRPDGEA